MIQTVNHSLPQHEANEIGQWLRNPAAKLYRKFIADEAARLTAEAGNLLVQPDKPGDFTLAKDHANEAAVLRKFMELLDNHSAADYKFEIADLKAKYSTT